MGGQRSRPAKPPMTTDLNKKTLRHFYCRDALWHCFERMSEDFDRGVDDLVNEAMRAFGRDKGYLQAENDQATLATPPPRVPSVPPPPPPAPRTTMVRPVAVSSGAPPSVVPAPPPPPAPRSSRTAIPAAPQAGASAPPLFVIFENKKYLVDKEQFIIGRGAKSSDLPIRDGNISRKHAAVIRRNGGYYIKDLGSTNGIDFQGNRVDNRLIEEGDTYHLCDYELRFTYK